ncbi:MAG: hypothetical protein AAF569_08055 [Pseudomonadota bacterium]
MSLVEKWPAASNFLKGAFTVVAASAALGSGAGGLAELSGSNDFMEAATHWGTITSLGATAGFLYDAIKTNSNVALNRFLGAASSTGVIVYTLV